LAQPTPLKFIEEKNMSLDPVTLKARRHWLSQSARYASLAGLASLEGSALWAQSDVSLSYPNKPVRLLCPFAPAGGVDITSRAMAQKLTEMWSQPVVVENKPGANGTIAVDTVAKSNPDGYTLTMISSSHSVNVTLQGHQPYDLTKDLAPITQATFQPYVLVINPQLPFKSVAELISAAQASPGRYTFGSSGLGGLSHLAGALLSSMAGIELTHIPYKGGAPAMADVIGGQVHMLFSTIIQSHAHIASGRLRPLAVTTLSRSRALPQLPTLNELGVKGYEVAGWYGVMAPAATPPAVLDKINKAMVKILKTPDMAERLAVDGSEPVGGSAVEFGEHIKKEVSKWRHLIKELGIKSE
jgi:tripartite-type tricarboxylate transporter receptor subunit TctC